jgi:SAM-dependent methyltransferase
LLALQERPEHKERAMSLLSNAAKKLLPKQAKRFILLNLMGVRRRYDHLRSHASRRFLEHEILPWLGKHYARVLFVGTAPYTHQFERLFRRSHEQYTTIDPVRGTEIWGARNHIVAPIQEIAAHRPKGYFDCIVFNGIFGFGIDDRDSQRAAIEILHDALAPGGLLLVGWNTNLMPDLDELGLFAPYFVEAKGLPWPHRTSFPLPETHVYDFYTQRN